MRSVRRILSVALGAVTASAIGLVAPQQALAAAPYVALDMTVVHTCLVGAECEITTDVFVCNATFNPGMTTNVAVTTAVECVAQGVNGASPGMELTTTPGPLATSGGYGNGLFGFDICVIGQSTYVVAGSTTTYLVSSPRVCAPYYDWNWV